MLLSDPANVMLRRTMVTASLAVLVLVVLSLFLIQLHLDDRARISLQLSENIVRQIQADKLQRLAIQTKDYAYWDDSVAALINQDLEWAEENYGEYLMETFDMYLSMVSNRAGEVFYHAAADDQAPDPVKLLSSEALKQLLNSAREQDLLIPAPVTGVVNVDGQILMVAAAMIAPSTDKFPGFKRDHTLLVAQRINEKYLTAMESLLLLDHLAVLDQPVEGGGNLPLTAPDGEALGYLHWSPRSRVDELGALAFIFAGFALLIVLIAIGLLWQIYSLAKRYALSSVIDELTGLHNRRYFNTISDQEMRRVRRGDYCIGFLLLDVDNFKKYNDYYGHVAGDKALQAISIEMANAFGRASDHVCRLGGEEFGIVFVSKTEDEIAIQAEQIRARIEKLSLPHAENPPSGVITVSIGAFIAHTRDGNCDLDRAYHFADQALYAAKSQGRNRVCLEKSPA